MATFSWTIDASNYLKNNHKHVDKLNFKKFINDIANELDNYNYKNWQDIIDKNNNHYCPNLSIKKSKAAKKLAKHLEKINEEAGKK